MNYPLFTLRYDISCGLSVTKLVNLRFLQLLLYIILLFGIQESVSLKVDRCFGERCRLIRVSQARNQSEAGITQKIEISIIKLLFIFGKSSAL
jgi:hypothetical protein